MEPLPNAEADLLPTYLDASATNLKAASTTSGNRTFRKGTAHCYELPDKHNHAWLKLTFSSRARTSVDMPRFLEGDKITGLVEMNLTKATTVKSVNVAVSVFQSEIWFYDSLDTAIGHRRTHRKGVP